MSWSGTSQCFKELINLLETDKATGVPRHSARASSSSSPHCLWSLEGSRRGVGSRRLSGRLATCPQPLHRGQTGLHPNPSHLLTSSCPKLEGTGVTPHCSGEEVCRGRPSEERIRATARRQGRPSAPVCPGLPCTETHVLAIPPGFPDAQPCPGHRLESTRPVIHLGRPFISAHCLFTYSPGPASIYAVLAIKLPATCAMRIFPKHNKNKRLKDDRL